MSNQLDTIRALNQQAWALAKKDGPRALQLARQAQALLPECVEAEPADEFECLKTQTYCLDMLSQPEAALPVGLKANQLAEQIGDKFLIGSIQSLLGRIYWHIDEYPTSMDYYLSALKLIEGLGHLELEVSLLNGLGLVQYGLQNYPEALSYFKACLEKAGEHDLTGRADACNNVAYVLHELGRDPEALPYGQEALALFSRLGTAVGKMETLHSLGTIQFTLRNYDQAMALLDEGLALSRRYNSRLLEISYVLQISCVRQARGEIGAAEQDLLAALQLAQAIDSLTNLSLIHERLVEINKLKQDYQAALQHFEAFHAVYKRTFNDRSDRRVKSLEIAHQVEMTRRQAELYRQLAGTDFLTGLVNRRRFMEIAESALERAKAGQGQFTLLLMDIDHFKNVNDSYGHQAGDAVLTALAAVIKKSLRPGDTAGRHGGEEFIVLVTQASSAQCAAIAERIRLAVARELIPIGQPAEAVSVTISLGLASSESGPELPLDALIEAADQALYAAKHQGRNRLVVWAGPQA